MNDCIFILGLGDADPRSRDRPRRPGAPESEEPGNHYREGLGA